ncbi:DUF4340 domain-containing protein [Ekhidna sp. MALMAid0563]|uniref:DUF4340 domain-containing protein n=1 Tax=Ekhidna sp. MALMAid0563 TaxID=3143937 RepID=UPI0032DFAC70
MKTKNLLIILAVLALALVVVQYTKKSGKSDVLAGELAEIDTAKVTRIQISSPDGMVKLREIENRWEVSLENGDYKTAKKSSVKSLLNDLNGITPGRLAARKEEKWKDYAVDSTGTRVQVFENNELTTDLVIGRFGTEGQRSFYTFIRPFEEENVYVAKDFMGISVGKKSADYRDGLLMRLKRDSLTQITFDYPDSAFTLTKGEKWYLDDQPADSAAVVKYLRGLSYVNSKKFYDDVLPSEPSHTITYAFNNAPEITVSGYLQDGNKLVKTTENVHEVVNDSTVVAKIFKGKNIFEPTSE